MPPQKAYNLRGVVSRKQDLEISPSPNLEQNSATFLSAGMAPGYIWAFGLHASQRVRSNCAEYLFKFNIKKYYCQCRALLCCASSPNKDPNHIKHCSSSRLFSVLNIGTAKNYTATSQMTLRIVAPAWTSSCMKGTIMWCIVNVLHYNVGTRPNSGSRAACSVTVDPW